VATHTERLITIGGSPGFRGSRQPERLFPQGLQVPLPEDAPRVETEDEFRFGYLARISEDAVIAQHEAGSYVATHLRYPLIYGPRQLIPMEWRVMRRILDGRKHIVVPDDGQVLLSRGYAVNMAHAVLLAVDQPEASGGKIYNCADVHQFTLAQWVEVIIDAMGGALEVVGIPGPYAYPARDFLIGKAVINHQLFDVHRMRADLGYTDIVPPLEGLAETVRWYRDNPPELDAEYEADLAAHYRTEDELTAINAEFTARLANVEHVSRPYKHPYAHPKTPNQSQDHRKR
jgi:nucleoside-diphosphate-sugar epimerase